MTSLTTNLGLEKITGADSVADIRGAVDQHADKLELQRPFICQVSRAASQTAATPFVVSWDTEDYDPHGMRSGGAPTLLTIPAGGAGIYLCVASVIVAPSPGASDHMIINIAANGVTQDPRGRSDETSTQMIRTISAMFGLDVGDTLSVAVTRAATPAALAVTVASLDVIRVSPMIAGGFPSLP